MKNTIYFKSFVLQLNLRLMCFTIFTLIFVCSSVAQKQLEFSNNSYPSAPTGLTTINQTASLLLNNAGSNFLSISPNVTITASITNQQYNNISNTRVSTGKAMNFGGRVNSSAANAIGIPVFNALNQVDSSKNNLFTSNPFGIAGTGIDINDNYGFYFYNSVDELFANNLPLNGRYYFGDINLTFSQPVNNPVIHVIGLGSDVIFGPSSKQGFTSELELQNSGLSLTSLSGSSEFNITSNKILNNAASPTFYCGNGAACGSVRVNGFGITSLIFKVFVRGDGNGQAWSHNAINAGDEFIISMSMNSGVSICGNVFKDANGLIDYTVNGVGTNLNNRLYINLIDSNNNVVNAKPVATNGSYCFSFVAQGNYKLLLSTFQGISGNLPPPGSLPINWVNTGESIGSIIGNDGNINGTISLSVDTNDINEVNFGIDSCYNINPIISSSGSTTSCNNSSLVLTSTLAPVYQWYKNDTVIIGATSQTYTPTQSGAYFVAVGNINCNNKSNTLQVTITYAATPSITPSDTAIICTSVNDKICPATWGYSNYQWYRNGVVIAAPQGTSSCFYPTLSGNYTLAAQNGAGCWSQQSASVYVKIDTICTGYVSGGGTGGVESKPLGDVIAQRIYGNAINSITEVDGIKDNKTFVSSGVVVNGLYDLKLRDLIPSSLTETDKALISSPTDLVAFTNAKEVFAVDYVKNNMVRAVVFSTKTLSDVYNHTKPICDRLRGSELLDVKVVKIKDYKLITYTIKQRTGAVEYAINLSAGTSGNRNTISLQSNWFTDSYINDEQLYNFQVWAASQSIAISLADSIITKLKTIANVNAVTNSDLPKSYITKGNRNNTELSVIIRNNTLNTTGYFDLKEKANEGSEITSRRIPFTIKANGLSTIQIPVKDFYETNIYVYLNNNLTDLVYLSDGTWNINYNKQATSISKFSVSNELNVNTNDNEYRLMRNVQVAANTKDYVTVYKTLLGGGIEKDLSSYNGLIFNTASKGIGKLQVTLIKKSILKWSEQYNFTIDFDGDKEYVIPFNKFKSSTSNQVINANDIVAVNFNYLTPTSAATNVNIDLNKVRFGKVLPIVLDENSTTIVLAPNPNRGSFNISFNSLSVQPLAIKIVELTTGREISRQSINAVKGLNKLAINVENYIAKGTYVLMIDGDGVKYEPIKLFINK